MPKRKIIVQIATSADGFIARKDGGIDWLEDPRFKGDYGMSKFFKSIDTILWGRKTYDLVLKFAKEGKGGPEMFGGVKNYAFSRRPPKKVARGFEFVKAPIKTFAKRLRSGQGKNIWMMGGGGIIGSFLDVGAIDEFIVHVIPVYIGEGIPLIAGNRTVSLKLIATKKYPDGVVMMHYEVTSARRSAKRVRSPTAREGSKSKRAK